MEWRNEVFIDNLMYRLHIIIKLEENTIKIIEEIIEWKTHNQSSWNLCPPYIK